jgi:hypothetical protein
MFFSLRTEANFETVNWLLRIAKLGRLTDASSPTHGWRSVRGKRKRRLELWKFLNAERDHPGCGNATLSRGERIIKRWICLATARRGLAHGVTTGCMPVCARKSQTVGGFVEHLSLVYRRAARITYRESDSMTRAIWAVRHIVMRVVMMTRRVRKRVTWGGAVAI